MPDFSLIASSIASAAAASGLTFVVCRGMFERRVQDMGRRLEVVEAARHLIDERAQQARRQVEQLQKDLAAARSSSPSPTASPPPSSSQRQALESMLREGDRAHAAPPSSSERPAMPVNGFADTLPMCVNPSRSTMA